MRLDKRFLGTIFLAGVATALWLLATVMLVGSTLEPAERALVAEHLAPRMALIVMTWSLGLGLIAATLNLLFQRYVRAPARLQEQTKMLLSAPAAAPLNHKGTRETEGLAHTIFELAVQRDALRNDVKEQIDLASSHIQQEKNRLAALMAELTQSVVVCNLDGRIILYNNRARMQFKTLSRVPAAVASAELLGIGRSIYAVFDRQLVAHALESIRQRLERGAAHPSAQFVTTTQAGQLLRVQMAPVRSVDAHSATAELNGFVLMLDNVTQFFEEEHKRDELLHGVIERSRSSLANIQTAVNMLGDTGLEDAARAKFLTVVREEVKGMGERVTELTQKVSQGLKARWPLEEMLGTDFLLAAQRRMEARSARKVTLEDVDSNIWLKIDSFSLAQALDYLAMRLVDEFDIKFFRLRLQEANGRAQLDLIWLGAAMSTETVMAWEMDSMRFGSESTSLTVRDVVERHGGEIWFERERVRHEALFRFLLPMASAQAQIEASQLLQSDSRPEYYDFDLFQATDTSRALDDQLLSTLIYTVFDTETTGLHPSQGDQIIQMGATRIVNGKLLRHENFDQLVDPKRPIPAATVPIHGITQEMVQGKPDIGVVLPVFHAFAQDTVLVAHNAAFDMRFLQLQEAATGLVFDHPVLDTLLLSAVVHPNQESHRLEAIAERFNITVLGRHTALGDALVTAEVWLRLLPLLQAMGIRTLRQAREAAQKTYFSRIKY